MVKMKSGLWISLFVLALLVACGFLFPSKPYGIGKDKAATIVTLARLKHGLEAFHQEYGHFPVGSVATLGRTLLGEDIGGQNPKRIQMLPANFRSHIDSKGNILDSWGQPLRIEFTSSNNVMISSTGRNRIDDGGRGDDMVVYAEPPPSQKP